MFIILPYFEEYVVPDPSKRKSLSSGNKVISVPSLSINFFLKIQALGLALICLLYNNIILLFMS